jgi:sugar lactone lactonase YvrE
MANNKVVRFALSDAAATAAAGVNITDARLAAKVEAGSEGLVVKGSVNVSGVCTDNSGNIYVADSARHVILKIEEGGTISVFAGAAGLSGNNTALMGVDALAARFNAPQGVACDNSGNVYVADTGNNQIRVISGNKVSLLAGNGEQQAGLVDGEGAAAQFNGPQDVAVDNAGVVYVADTANHSIRQIKGGTVLTIAGSEAGDQSNVAGTARSIFDSPGSVACDAEGNVYVGDTNNNKIKKITTDGWVYRLSGSGNSGITLGNSGDEAFSCEYVAPKISDVDESGNLYVIDVDTTNSRLLKLDYNGVPSVVHAFAATTDAGSVVNATVSPGQKIFAIFAG